MHPQIHLPVLSNTKSALTNQCHPLFTQKVSLLYQQTISTFYTAMHVYKGSKSSSWHGTTVQAVQPLPSLSIYSEACTQDTSTTATDVVIPPYSATVSHFDDPFNLSQVLVTARDPTLPLLEGELFTASCFLPDATSSSEIRHPSRKRVHRSSPFPITNEVDTVTSSKAGKIPHRYRGAHS